MKLNSLTLALTAFNEDQALSQTVGRGVQFLRNNVESGELLIINDGSTDRTQAVAEDLERRYSEVRLINHSENKGMGAGIKSAIHGAKGEWFCTIAADGQVDPLSLVPFVDAAPGSDVVFSTYTNRWDGLDRWILSMGIRFLIFLLTGKWRLANGVYFIKLEHLRSFALLSDTFVLNYEVFFNAAQRQLKRRWVVIPCQPRQSGKSKVLSCKRVWRVFHELLRYRLNRNR